MSNDSDRDKYIRIKRNRFIRVENQVDRILQALTGDEELGQKSIPKKIREAEQKAEIAKKIAEENRDYKKKIYNRVIGFGSAAGIIGSLIMWLLKIYVI